MAQSTIGQRWRDMFANTRRDKCANRWGVFDSCGTDQHLSDITVELTGRGDYIQPSPHQSSCETRDPRSGPTICSASFIKAIQ
jgi:hypothetical protein